MSRLGLIISTIIVGGAIAVMIALGMWQLDRMAWKNALLESYAAEVAKLSPLRVAIVDPGATRTEMRARAYPGENPETVKAPEVVAERIVALLQEDFATGHRERIEG